MESSRGKGLAVVHQHLVQAHLEIAHGNSTVARIMFSNVVMVRVVMPSPKDGIAAADGKGGRSARIISQRCATIKGVVATTAAAQLADAISLDMVAGRAAVKEIGLVFSPLRLVAASSTIQSSLVTRGVRGVRVWPNHDFFMLSVISIFMPRCGEFDNMVVSRDPLGAWGACLA